ncbi:replication protein [Vibrio penaeicida]|uniref:Bacteriophage lambda Replication protein O N-terminal domain-containing protein n=2 Tax=Vibrio penaeicida TaxID=104609 RepID=A0AAV5NR08_9VIBR|nr:replication protein [Vibrio penaeicida]GLQ72702.1 hypothetical protein GCM10007932_20620 [Vibrio penaeicida]
MNAQVENIVVFPKSEQETARKASLKEGYYQVANQIGLALCKVSLSSRESRLVQAILFKTFGYHKSSDWICYDQLSELTGIDRSNIGKVKASLIHRRILLRDGKKIGINPATSQWVMNIRNGSTRSAQRETQPLSGTSEEEKRVRIDSCQSQKRLKKSLSDSAQKESELTFEKVEIDSQKSQFRPPQKKNTLQNTNRKKINKKKNPIPPDKKPLLPPAVDFSVFENITPEQVSEIKRIRKSNKGGPISQRVANQLAKEFVQARQYGFSLEDCLTEWESRGWKSFKAAWVAPKERYHSKPYPDFHSGDTSWAKDLGW